MHIVVTGIYARAERLSFDVFSFYNPTTIIIIIIIPPSNARRDVRRENDSDRPKRTKTKYKLNTVRYEIEINSSDRILYNKGFKGYDFRLVRGTIDGQYYYSTHAHDIHIFAGVAVPKVEWAYLVFDFS